MELNEIIVFFMCILVVLFMQIPLLILGNSNDCYFSDKTIKKLTVPQKSVLRKLLENFKNTGEDTYFEIQVTNEDPTSSAGRQTLVFIDCNIDGGILAKFDADGEYLDEDCDGTFEDFKMPETFKLLDGML